MKWNLKRRWNRYVFHISHQLLSSEITTLYLSSSYEEFLTDIFTNNKREKVIVEAHHSLWVNDDGYVVAHKSDLLKNEQQMVSEYW